MGLLDMVTGALGSSTANGENPLMNMVMQMVSNSNSGGLQGLLQSLQDGGLAEQAASWVGTGSNLPVSADQIKNALSSGQLGQIASQLGISEDDTAGGLADILPNVIDKLTPNGQIPEGDLLAQGLSMLKGKLFS
jgi:uncharacterized protein YidB (DUF937 family)